MKLRKQRRGLGCWCIDLNRLEVQELTADLRILVDLAAFTNNWHSINRLLAAIEASPEAEAALGVRQSPPAKSIDLPPVLLGPGGDYRRPWPEAERGQTHAEPQTLDRPGQGQSRREEGMLLDPSAPPRLCVSPGPRPSAPGPIHEDDLIASRD